MLVRASVCEGVCACECDRLSVVLTCIGTQAAAAAVVVVSSVIVLCCYSVRQTEMSAHTRNAFVTQFPTSVILLPVTSPHHSTAHHAELCSAEREREREREL